MADCPATQGWTGGRVADPAVFKHVGWPNPDLLLPVPPFGFAAISKMMLSGCVGSPANRLAGPGTAGREPEAARGSRPRRARTRQAMVWSAQEVSPLTPPPPTV